MKYNVTITAIGNLSSNFLYNNNSLIILNQNTSPNLADMVVEHTIAPINGTIQVGDTLTIGIQTYPITGIGNEVIKNLLNDGHCTIIFNKKIELPGQLSVQGYALPRLVIGDKIFIK